MADRKWIRQSEKISKLADYNAIIIDTTKINKMQQILITNAKEFGKKIVNIALPLRLGIFSILTSKSVSIFNTKICEIISKISEDVDLGAEKFN